MYSVPARTTEPKSGLFLSNLFRYPQTHLGSARSPIPPLLQKKAPHPPGGAFALRLPVDRRRRMGSSAAGRRSRNSGNGGPHCTRLVTKRSSARRCRTTCAGPRQTADFPWNGLVSLSAILVRIGARRGSKSKGAPSRRPPAGKIWFGMKSSPGKSQFNVFHRR
jgi:hypothetical protein